MKSVIAMMNSKYIHSSLAPWCLFAGVKAYCGKDVEAVVIEGTVNENPQAVIDRLVAQNADVYGFCCYIWNINFVKKIASEVKKLTNAKIVFGGPEVSYNAYEILSECDAADFVLSGEGEESFACLCNTICRNETDYSSIEGLCFRENGKIIIHEPVVSGKEPVSPYCEEYFSSLKGRIAYIEASRGCPFSCAFCLSGRCGSLLLYDIERLKNEIILLANSGAQTVKFIDRTFNAKEERANEILNFIIGQYGKKIPANVCFHLEIDGGTLKESTVEILKTAPVGLFQLEIGLQSFNPETLRAVHRNPDTSRLEKNLKTLINLGNMHIHADLIAGLPNENLDSFRNSFNKLYSFRPHMLQLGFLKLLHGSELRSGSDLFGCEYNKNAPYEVISTSSLSQEDLQTVHYAENALDRLYNSSRFEQTLEYLTGNCGFSPFDLFASFGCFTKEKNNIPLDEYLTLLYNFFVGKTESSVLRDKLVCDRLSSNSSGVLPDCLKIEDSRLKQIKKYLSENLKLKGRFSAAILYSENKAVYCDYKKKNPVTGNYDLSFLEINDL